MKKVVCFYSFYGHFSDNPRAIYEEMVRRDMDYEYVWLVKPGVEVSGPARAVELHSDESRSITRTADYLIANTYIDDHEINPEAVYVQTWHGTPLKRLAFDNPTFPPEAVPLLEYVTKRWDYFVSPNPFASEKLSGAFHFQNRLLETGYPRNDVLYSSEADAIRQRVRTELGIAPAATAVLYAPTFRDDLLDEHGNRSAELRLDVDRLQRELGDDVVILLRLHYWVAPTLGDNLNEHLLNVSAHEDISDLYLASDLLLTDYSSSMFDYANTGKPIAFFVYDIEHYRDNLRGFYFDFLSEAPGPVSLTTDEVLDALSNRAALPEQYAEKYAAWQNKYCVWDDGQASARLIDAVFPSSQ